jgi:hypothetical protein
MHDKILSWLMSYHNFSKTSEYFISFATVLIYLCRSGPSGGLSIFFSISVNVRLRMSWTTSMPATESCKIASISCALEATRADAISSAASFGFDSCCHESVMKTRNPRWISVDIHRGKALAARTGVEPEYLPPVERLYLCTAILYGHDPFSDHVRSK